MGEDNCHKTHPLELAISFFCLVFIIWANHTHLTPGMFFVTRHLFSLAALLGIPFLMVWEPKLFTEFIPRVHSHRHTKLIGLSVLALMAAVSAIRLF